MQNSLLRELARSAYDMRGVQGVIDLTNNLKEPIIDHRYCLQCNEVQPVIKGEVDCLVCGSDTEPNESPIKIDFSPFAEQKHYNGTINDAGAVHSFVLIKSISNGRESHHVIIANLEELKSQSEEQAKNAIIEFFKEQEFA